MGSDVEMRWDEDGMTWDGMTWDKMRGDDPAGCRDPRRDVTKVLASIAH